MEYACFYHECQFNFNNPRKTAPYNEHQFAALAVNAAIVTKQGVRA
ncbi:MAG: hypothetical protein ACI9H9_000930 [Pseudoalteromonas tetraodonis]|uniref:Uncharacterized protein n=1 Tax=Pseudoalteromonas issachenkonii TaxID=152297 RepID=A0ABN5BZ71_9GAMM|nr:hypothetical protein PSM_A0988 [Pseudoalteromonas sp. SM9913]ATC90069.1 hypothetical protein PISS_a1106 [Pseudoalteromonas issachenkonii]ATD02604.1 hypothetical protein PTET_a1118 [Pseudoalteromonas tetraodonis]